MDIEHKIDEWSLRLRNMPEADPYIQPGMAHSYPLLAQYDDGSMQLRYFFHRAEQAGPNVIYFWSPHVYATIRAEDFTDFKEVPDAFSHIKPFERVRYELSIEKMAENDVNIDRFKKVYDILLGERFNIAPEEIVRSEFARLFYEIIPPMLMPFYEAMAPEFIAWLKL